MKSNLSFFLLLASSAALAETDTLPPVVVTATRTAQSVDERLASVSVITREGIEKKQLLSVQGALFGIPGINVSTGALANSVSV